jgi:ATP-dependent DNA helicase RecG
LSGNTGQLRQILELEEKKGYPDTTVIGGLDRYLLNWLSQLTSFSISAVVLKQISNLCRYSPGYTALSQGQRKKWVEQMLVCLDKLENPAQAQAILGKNAGIAFKAGEGIKITKKITRVPAAIKKSGSPKLLDSPLIVVKGINEVLQKRFYKLGIQTVRDLLYFFPHRHLDYSKRAFINNLIVGQENTIIANIWEAREVRLGSRRSAEATVGDETGNVRVVWFNQPYLAKSLKTGSRVVISGRVTVFGGMPVFESPEWEPYEEKDLVHTGRLVPVYPLTQGLSQRQVRRILKPAVDQWIGQLDEFLPDELVRRLSFLDRQTAIRQAHYPDDENTKNAARRRLAFDELFLLQIGVLNNKRNWQESRPGRAIKTDRPELNRFIESLPYKLTSAQNHALRDILNDIGKAKPMSRLLQGEVGSGKTVVAAAALILSVADGYQGAIMAPTEILAEQHFGTLRRMLSQLGGERGDGLVYTFTGFLSKPVTVGLLIGDFSQVKKHKLQQRIASGEIDIAIGTHALIQKDTVFNNLGLVVVDEQHRFGVEQRSALRQKGANPHMLVMTATPIPRTLALTLYGDLDLSVINELPPGRQIIKTRWLRPDQRGTAYNFIRQQVNNGRQAFIICPLVEESESIQARAAVAEFEQLSQEVFPELRLGLLHGRMPSKDKDEVMQRFNTGELNILVSTPVVEVGIDVPNATVMMIESADRFGLSQLHQFRGRVGRGPEQSYCMLMAERPSEISKSRLDLIEKTNNGFILAEEDLKLRGPGEFFGTRQSGLPDLKMARLSDVTLLELARNEAARLFKVDPDLKQADHKVLAVELARVWSNTTSESS